MTTPANAGDSQGGLIPGDKVGAGRFTLVRFLGRGGMGVVWLARDERLQEDVALKFLAGEISHDADALEDMRRETKKSRQLSHPNIIRIHDLFEEPGEAPFIAMEYVDGRSLSALKAEQPQRLFEWPAIEGWVRQLCEALEYAHGQKVIHRDLKPANLMVDGEGRLKLADFGIAASAGDSLGRLTRRPGSSGTPSYMSPQQMNSQAPRVSDDIYSLGATLYELLTSRPPFYTGDIYRQVQDTPATPLVERVADLNLQNEIPPGVADVILLCLAKEATKRPGSVRWAGGALKIWPDMAPRRSRNREIGMVVAVVVVGLLLVWAWIGGLKGPGSQTRRSNGAVVRAMLVNGRWTNSMGMVFVPVPGADVLFCIWETRRRDYASYAEHSPGVDYSWQNPVFDKVLVGLTLDDPVVNVNWRDARDFCAWATRVGHAVGRLPARAYYRLPTDLEWSAAVGLLGDSGSVLGSGATSSALVYPWGNQWPPPARAGNFFDRHAISRFDAKEGLKSYVDGYDTTSPVGSFDPNRFGIYDLAGNVWELCEDGDGDAASHVLRGGSWRIGQAERLKSTFRENLGSNPSLKYLKSRKSTPDVRAPVIGFRVVVAGAEGSAK